MATTSDGANMSQTSPRTSRNQAANNQDNSSGEVPKSEKYSSRIVNHLVRLSRYILNCCQTPSGDAVGGAFGTSETRIVVTEPEIAQVTLDPVTTRIFFTKVEPKTIKTQIAVKPRIGTKTEPETTGVKANQRIPQNVPTTSTVRPTRIGTKTEPETTQIGKKADQRTPRNVPTTPKTSMSQYMAELNRNITPQPQELPVSNSKFMSLDNEKLYSQILSQNVKTTAKRKDITLQILPHPVKTTTIKKYINFLDLYPTAKIPNNQLQPFLNSDWQHDNVPLYSNSIETINNNSTNFSTILATFNRHVYSYTLHIVEQNRNPILWLMYQLKKEEIRVRHGECTERQLFHGTKVSCVPKICEQSFNWRLAGDHIGHRYGKGVYFTPNPWFANYFVDSEWQSGGSYRRQMVLTRVAIARSTCGASWMELPPEGFDTTNNERQGSFVKYEDFSCYPDFVLTYR